MSDYFREELEAIYREDDRLRAAAKEYERQRMQCRKQPQTYEPAVRQTSPVIRQAANTMDPAAQARWDEWCDERIMRQVEMLADVVGSETARNERKLEKRLRAEIETLRRELNLLRSKAEGNVTPIDRMRKDGTNG